MITMFSQTDLYICASAFLLLSFAYVVALCFVCFLTDDLSSKRAISSSQKKRNKMANKSDELATKEMPFRCYVGYDSHEDITFEVSTSFCRFRFVFCFSRRRRRR